MQPTFVTMTYPNHISIATGKMNLFFTIYKYLKFNLGLYQEDHGIIHNRFFDIKINKTVTFGKKIGSRINSFEIKLFSFCRYS